jgi:hypothetical protein
MRQFGQAPVTTPAAIKKQRIAGAFIGAAVVLDLVATSLGVGGKHPAATIAVYCVASLLMLGGIVYIMTTRRTG